MSEADRVFPARKRQGFQPAASEQRLIQGRPRRGEMGSGQTRVVEVVHIRRDRAQSGTPSRTDPSSAHAETWLEGFRAKPAQQPPAPDIPEAVPASVQPTVHVMPMWKPSSPQPAEPAVPPDATAAATVVAGRGRPRIPKAPASQRTVRRFADPFADEDGANCIRCGYLVEPAREKRGLLTCSVCG